MTDFALLRQFDVRTFVALVIAFVIASVGTICPLLACGRTACDRPAPDCCHESSSNSAPDCPLQLLAKADPAKIEAPSPSQKIAAVFEPLADIVLRQDVRLEALLPAVIASDDLFLRIRVLRI